MIVVVALLQVLKKALSFPAIPTPLPVFLISLFFSRLAFSSLPSSAVEPRPGSSSSKREGGGNCRSHGTRPHEGSKLPGMGGCLPLPPPSLQTLAAQKKGK